jgi:hypothetical protein
MAKYLLVNGKIVISRLSFEVFGPIEGTGMPHYRVHIMDQGGDLKGAIDLDCANDEAARERVAAVLEGHCGELWRLVTLYELDSPSIVLEPP